MVCWCEFVSGSHTTSWLIQCAVYAFGNSLRGFGGVILSVGMQRRFSAWRARDRRGRMASKASRSGCVRGSSSSMTISMAVLWEGVETRGELEDQSINIESLQVSLW
jgi:hypothetical protein